MVMQRLKRTSVMKSLFMDRDEREIKKMERRIAELRNGRRGLVDGPLLSATARALNTTVGKYAGRLVSHGLRNRSERIFSYIQPFIGEGDSVLDLGCGDGKVGELVALRKKSDVVLMDVVDYNKTGLPLVLYDGRKVDCPDRSFDHVLLLTVLHHSDDPIAVMEEALRVADKSVIIIESVYFNGPHKQVNKFFDWFYNRVLNNPKINVPFNFLTPTAWIKLFEKLGGKVMQMEHLGIDEPTVPEWHTLYVVDK
jgi:SAM-dependent methyltransferase